MVKPLVILQVVSWNSSRYLNDCIDSLIGQELSEYRKKIVVIDNASSDNTAELLNSKKSVISIKLLPDNMGFTGAHNLGIAEAISEGADFICLINPDLTLESNTILRLIEATKIGPKIGASTPLLYRTQSDKKTSTLDACGMELFSNLRHLDRGSNKALNKNLNQAQYVFGGTGACLMLTRESIIDTSYPLHLNAEWKTPQFFDPLFFAYREDAEISLRFQMKGWRIRYEPTAIGYHVRQVLPENRHEINNKINGLSVRNRFLIQANCAPILFLILLLPKWVFRNLLVIGACLVYEHSSLPYLKELFTNRKEIRKKRNWNLNNQATTSISLSSIVEGYNRSQEIALIRSTNKQKIEASVHAVIIAYFSSSELLLNVKSVLISLAEMPEAKLSIVNNSPEDTEFLKTKELITSYTKDYPNVVIEFIENNRNLGFGGAANRALLNSEYEFFLILNSDIELEADTLKKLTPTFSDFENLAAVSPLITDKQTHQIQYQYLARRFPRCRDPILDILKFSNRNLRTQIDQHRSYADIPALQELISDRKLEQTFEVEQISGACLMIKASIFRELQGFNENFFPAWFEDVDLCKRISDLGLSSAVSNKATVSHLGAESLESLSKSSFSAIFLGNKIKYYKLHEKLCFRKIIGISLIYLEFTFKLLSIYLKKYKNKNISNVNSKFLDDIKLFLKTQTISK